MRHCVSEWLRPYRWMLAAGWLVLLSAGVPQPVMAENVDDLYQAEVPVSSQEAAERQTALGEALRAVLVKVSGDRAPERQAAVAKTLPRASRLLQAYDYHRVQPSQSLTQVGEVTPDKPDLLLRARFDPKAVESLLSRAQLPVWGRARPSLLVWLAVEEGGLRYLMGQTTEHPLREVMFTLAGQRGLPLHLPLLDAEDQANIQFMDIWADFTDVVLAASRRYAADRVLVGRLYKDPGGFWGVRWSLYSGKGSQDGTAVVWEAQHQTPAEAVSEGLAVTADSLAKEFAVHYHASDDQQGLVLEIQDVNTLQDYARVNRYLESLEPVTQLIPSRVDAGRLRLELQVRGGIESLHQIIALGRVLAVDAGPGPVQGSPAPVPGLPAPGFPTAGTPATETQTTEPPAGLQRQPEPLIREGVTPVLKYRLLP